ncbi:Protein of unknown function (DUF2927) [Litoreibacter halocynthiae]|uniref:DUF2927 family protein n=1 Tax=Litoreibacter halocynthiae TaxID=1242689 RepID=A0A4R7LS75_9RHOB|nr:DUF2927 domain-containing protein [Litoreibacter halocynthiae]TDT77100.1 Protein of unknown function (DUF2927) [Litoreibacter halocynthiae]
MRASLHIALAGLMAVTLSACDAPVSSPRPEQRVAPAPKPAPKLVEPSERSKELSAYYAQVQRSLLSQGLLRTDGGGIDTPFSKRQLVNNFIQIGVFNEFTLVDGLYTNQRSEGRVQRWEKPINISMQFGPAVPQSIRTKDQQTVANYARRLSRVSGAKVGVTRGKGNFHVAVLTIDEIEAFGPQLMKLIPGLDAGIARQITSMPRPIYCAVYAFSDADTPNSFHSAVAIVRAEHPDLLRQSCYHEEIAQGLGLSNDSPAARPSIFNDDDEFALLTRHDEILLQILYDQRLPLGTSPARARPIVEVIASELLGGES